MELDLKDWKVKAYLIERKTTSQKPENYLIPRILDLNDEFKREFKEILNNFLTHNNLDNNFIEFFSSDLKDKKYKITKKDVDSKNKVFDILLKRIKNNSNLEVLNKEFKKNYLLIVEFVHNQEKIYYFRKLNKIKAGSKKWYSVYSGELRLFEGDFFWFDKYIDFVYIDNIDNSNKNETFFINTKKIFEIIFKINEYYVDKSKKFFDKFNDLLVFTDNSLKEVLINDNILNKRISRILGYSDAISYKKLKEIESTTDKILGYKLKDNKIEIKDKKSARDLFDVIEERIGTPIYNKTKIIRYYEKEEILKNGN